MAIDFERSVEMYTIEAVDERSLIGLSCSILEGHNEREHVVGSVLCGRDGVFSNSREDVGSVHLGNDLSQLFKVGFRCEVVRQGNHFDL